MSILKEIPNIIDAIGIPINFSINMTDDYMLIENRSFHDSQVLYNRLSNFNVMVWNNGGTVPNKWCIITKLINHRRIKYE